MKTGNKEIKADAVSDTPDAETDGSAALNERPARGDGNDAAGAARVTAADTGNGVDTENAAEAEPGVDTGNGHNPSPQSPDGDSPPSPQAGEGAACNDGVVAGETAADSGNGVDTGKAAEAEPGVDTGNGHNPSPQSPDGGSPSPQAGEGAACNDDAVAGENDANTENGVEGRDGTRPLWGEDDPALDESSVETETAQTEDAAEPESEPDDRPEPDPFESALFDRWDREIHEAESRYPGFDMRREMADPRFARMAVEYGVCEAYEAVHRRELTARLCAAAYRLAAEDAAQRMSANLTRPAEGGLARTAAPLVRVDPRHLTNEQRLDVRRRVKSGEIITF